MQEMAAIESNFGANQHTSGKGPFSAGMLPELLPQKKTGPLRACISLF